jgi:hypothetical protein
VDTIFSKVIVVPRSIDGYARYFTAVNEYFLADLSANGLYKFYEDGSFAKVHYEATVDAFYEWKGKVYAYADWAKVLLSSDNGINWQEYR